MSHGFVQCHYTEQGNYTFLIYFASVNFLVLRDFWLKEFLHLRQSYGFSAV